MSGVLANDTPQESPWAFAGVQGELPSNTWLVVLGSLFAFAMAWAIGANDMANAFATSVGSKALKLWQACLIAAVLEFVGAVVLGGQVVNTVVGSITSAQAFEDVPEVFAFGMLCALIAAWLWVTTATYLEIAVSTTHSIIGAIMGFSLVFGGSQAVVWNETTAIFPYRKGFTPIIITWFTSPLIAGLVSGLLFTLNRSMILRRPESTTLILAFLAPLTILTIYINVFFVIVKGGDKELAWSQSRSAWVAACVAGGCGLLAVPLALLLRMRFRLLDERLVASGRSKAAPGRGSSCTDTDLDSSKVSEASPAWGLEAGPAAPGYWTRLRQRILFSVTVDIHKDIPHTPGLAEMHGAGEVFELRTEGVYKYLQVFSACCVALVHGANDVANAAGPLAAIWHVFQYHSVSSSASMPRWVLVLTGAGLTVGVTTYAYNIIKVLGVKMAKMTPSRGYCAELATSFTVAVASVYGLPVSTTHCIVGAEVGVGLLEHWRTGVNWRLLARLAIAWVLTPFASAAACAVIFAFGAFSPNMATLTTIGEYQAMLLDSLANQTSLLHAANIANNASFGQYDAGLAGLVGALTGNVSRVLDRETGKVDINDLRTLVTYGDALFLSQTLLTPGYNASRASASRQSLTVPSFSAAAGYNFTSPAAGR
ncbi:sodium/phosphate symporter [Haematococcus lacustris]